MINDVQQLDGALEQYQLEHGVYATSLGALTNYLRKGWKLDYEVQFVRDGKRWSIAVPQQGLFAGYYLFTSEWRIHFNRDRPATTNDLDLNEIMR